MFHGVFGGINLGGLSNKHPKSRCGCGCLHWVGQEQQLSNCHKRASTGYNGDCTVNPTPDQVNLFDLIATGQVG